MSVAMESLGQEFPKPAEKLLQITSLKVWYGDNNRKLHERHEDALCGCPHPIQLGYETGPQFNSHWCWCKSNRTHFFLYPKLDRVVMLSWIYYKFGIVNYLTYLLLHICVSPQFQSWENIWALTAEQTSAQLEKDNKYWVMSKRLLKTAVHLERKVNSGAIGGLPAMDGRSQALWEADW